MAEGKDSRLIPPKLLYTQMCNISAQKESENMGMRQIQLQVRMEKVPQIIDPDKIVRLSFPGERIGSHRVGKGVLALSTTGPSGEIIQRIYNFGGAEISEPLFFQEPEGLRLIFRQLT